MKHKSDIDRFLKYFDEQIKKISSLNIENNENEKIYFYKKLLFLSIIDTLGQSRFPKGDNKKRIISFIRECSDWEDKDRVSLVQLSYILDYIYKYKPKEKSDSKLYKYAENNKPNLYNGGSCTSNIDPFFKNIKKIASGDEEKQVLKKHVMLSCYTHIEID